MGLKDEVKGTGVFAQQVELKREDGNAPDLPPAVMSVIELTAFVAIVGALLAAVTAAGL